MRAWYTECRTRRLSSAVDEPRVELNGMTRCHPYASPGLRRFCTELLENDRVAPFSTEADASCLAAGCHPVARLEEPRRVLWRAPNEGIARPHHLQRTGSRR